MQGRGSPAAASQDDPASGQAATQHPAKGIGKERITTWRNEWGKKMPLFFVFLFYPGDILSSLVKRKFGCSEMSSKDGCLYFVLEESASAVVCPRTPPMHFCTLTEIRCHFTGSGPLYLIFFCISRHNRPLHATRRRPNPLLRASTSRLRRRRTMLRRTWACFPCSTRGRYGWGLNATRSLYDIVF